VQLISGLVLGGRTSHKSDNKLSKKKKNQPISTPSDKISPQKTPIEKEKKVWIICDLWKFVM
jgi:hypothetical protein